MTRHSLLHRFPLRVTAALVAATGLLAGCGGGDENAVTDAGGAGHDGAADGIGGTTGSGGLGPSQVAQGAGGTASTGAGGTGSGDLTGSSAGGTSNWHTGGGASQGMGGSLSGTGGVAQSTGGRTQGSGGATQNTGGRSQGLGGSTENAGGSSDSVGGSTENTGGSAQNTGGRFHGTGGRFEGTGGRFQGTGGSNDATGGSSTPGSAGSEAGGSGGESAGGSSGSGGESSGETGGTDMGGGTSTGGSSGAGTDDCPPGIVQEITVASDGSGQFATVGAAIGSLPNGSSTPTRINIRAGSYYEKLAIGGRSHLCLVGESAETTILTYDDNNASAGGTSASASTTITADDFSAAHLTFANSRPLGSEQAVALLCDGDRQQFLDCRFTSYQDTLYTKNGSQYFRDCYVEGNVDYVFGGATAVLENCEVRNISSGSAVAAPNTASSTQYGIVFLGGRLTATSNIAAGSIALARPWGADGMAAYLGVELGAHISAPGWTDMSGNDPANARFWEHNSTGPGANPSARIRPQLTDAQAASYTLSNIFPSWVPSYSE